MASIEKLPSGHYRVRWRDGQRDDAGKLTLRETKNGTTVVHPLLAAHMERYRGLVAGRAGTAAHFLNPYEEEW